VHGEETLMNRNVQTVMLNIPSKFKKHVVRIKFDNYHWVDTSAGGLLVPEMKSELNKNSYIINIIWLIRLLQTIPCLQVSIK
jgi:hypothetical protein